MEHQNRGTRKEKTQKEIAAEIGKHLSTVSREYKRNATARGGYNDTKAQVMAEERRSHGEPHNKTPRLLLWRIEQWIKNVQWSPAQIIGTLAKEGHAYLNRQSTITYMLTKAASCLPIPDTKGSIQKVEKRAQTDQDHQYPKPHKHPPETQRSCQLTFRRLGNGAHYRQGRLRSHSGPC